MPEYKIKVKEFYRGKNILITGCTGFLGKVILEKMLRTCPDVLQFYIMVRPKRKIHPMARIRTEMLTSPCFKKIRAHYGEEGFWKFVNSKITPIQGDLTLEGLGIPPNERQMIVENVNVIINSAASINFDDPL
jgi:fatty acyl-CoA reductase